MPASSLQCAGGHAHVQPDKMDELRNVVDQPLKANLRLPRV